MEASARVRSEAVRPLQAFRLQRCVQGQALGPFPAAPAADQSQVSLDGPFEDAEVNLKLPKLA